MSHYLGIDIGTSGTKTLLIAADGRVVAEASSDYSMVQPQPGWTEQDPENWWAATVATVREVMGRSKLPPFEVKGIGLSGQMHGSVFLDQADRVIRPALLWNDQRTTAECEEITSAAGGRRELIQMVANPALTGFQAPKVLWLRNHEPANFERLAKVLLPKDEIRRRLTGEYITDVSDASGTLFFDVVRRRWSTELLSKLGLDSSLLPTSVESEEVTGKLTVSAAESLGLTTDCLVVGGAGDCAAGAVGNGVVDSGTLSTSIGTSGVMFVHSDQPQFDADGRLHTFCHAVRGKWHMMGVNLTSGGSLQWWVDQVLQGLEGIPSSQRYETATREAAAAKVGSGGLLFLPYLNGERTPHADPDASGAFVGLNLTHGRAEMTRAVMEGVTYALRDSLQIIRSLEVPVRQIRASGGGSKNLTWRQMQADVFGHRVSTLAVQQGPAFGAALLAAVGDRAFSSIQQACQATISVDTETEPEPDAVGRYDQLFPVYQGLYTALAGSMKSLADQR